MKRMKVTRVSDPKAAAAAFKRMDDMIKDMRKAGAKSTEGIVWPIKSGKPVSAVDAP